MPSLSPAVIQFLTGQIRSLEELHMLLTVVESRERWWDPTSAGRELGISTMAARNALDHLARRNLLDIRITDDVRYRFSPGTRELEATVRPVVDAYRSSPLAVVRLVTGSGRRGLRDFADAFRIRPDADDR